jgi:hypothetical protein
MPMSQSKAPRNMSISKPLSAEQRQSLGVGSALLEMASPHPPCARPRNALGMDSPNL